MYIDKDKDVKSSAEFCLIGFQFTTTTFLSYIFTGYICYEILWWIIWFPRWKSSLPRKLIKQERKIFFFSPAEAPQHNFPCLICRGLHCLFSILNNVITFSDVSPSLHIINFHNSTSQMENLEHWDIFQWVLNVLRNNYRMEKRKFSIDMN